MTSQIRMFDDLGNAHEMSVVMECTGTNTWSLTVQEAGQPPVVNALALTFSGTAPTTGQLVTPAGSTTFTPATAGYASWGGAVTLDLGGLTQFGGASTAAGKANENTGSALGTLESYSLSNDGTIVGLYSNGLRQPLGQLALATFVNPGGLSKAGNSSFRAGDNSGQPVVGQAGTGGRGQLSAGSLEMSNVDLAEEFTGLIVAQRGFQANSRVITTSDEILQDLVQLKR
ncbi:flagellar hook protein FlgE [Modestobacter roseus]|uniref:Flagellar hook protein FlgE n=1 Tax=Modestobacter roseus TaxID=1181884 RepID=A0A562IKQ3_9ACTN|nr:flagellar hook-basal body complex protein [Modestobacter roseus]TWH71597.1 flagellar hook protein FlgE [Modestobacter roseus]